MEKYTEEALQEAFKSMRKLERFHENNSVNFVWPSI